MGIFLRRNLFEIDHMVTEAKTKNDTEVAIQKLCCEYYCWKEEIQNRAQ
jgi:hypothetical protein